MPGREALGRDPQRDQVGKVDIEPLSVVPPTVEITMKIAGQVH